MQVGSGGWRRATVVDSQRLQEVSWGLDNLAWLWHRLRLSRSVVASTLFSIEELPR